MRPGAATRKQLIITNLGKLMNVPLNPAPRTGFPNIDPRLASLPLPFPFNYGACVRVSTHTCLNGPTTLIQLPGVAALRLMDRTALRFLKQMSRRMLASLVLGSGESARRGAGEKRPLS